MALALTPLAPSAEVPNPAEPVTPVVPDAPIAPADPDPGTPADPGQPAHEHALVGGERPPGGGTAQDARRGPKVGLLDLEQVGDPAAHAGGGQREAGPSHQRRPNQLPGQRPCEPIVEWHERGAVGC